MGGIVRPAASVVRRLHHIDDAELTPWPRPARIGGQCTMPETITLRNTENTERPAQAEVFRYADAVRITKATMFLVGGFLFGAACILIPVLHFITTWALPLLGVVMFMKTIATRVEVRNIEGICPSCGEGFALSGGALHDPRWQVCPKCRQPLRIDVPAKLATSDEEVAST
jgi:hypothetical protein